MIQKKLTEIKPKKEAKKEKAIKPESWVKQEKEEKPEKEVIKAEELAKKQREISVAEFFAKNRHLLGFDNPRKALLTTVKEAVDNALDACEEMRVTPDIIVMISPLDGKEASVADRFLISVEDNGPGIVKQQVPRIFAKLLYGSKFHTMKMSRGQQGIGISAAGMYGQLTTGKPVKITTRISPKKPAMYYELHIDTQKNEPEILKEEETKWEKDHGTRVSIELEARYVKGRQSVEEYLKQTAIANPHASIIYYSPENQKVDFPRATKDLPIEPKAIKPHPYGVELGMLMNMLKETKARNLQAFLKQEFSRVSPRIAKEICQKAGLFDNARPSRIATQEVDKLYKAINETKIMAPPTNCLAPIGEELMIKGLKKEVSAEFYAAATRPPAVYRGNPFQIECCTGDTELVLESGEIITISKFVENRINKKVFAMDDKLRILPTNVIAWHKFKNEHKIFKIKTKSGRELSVTDNNELPIIENGEIIWKESKDVMAGDFIAAPRRYNLQGRIPNILDLFEGSDDNIQIADKQVVNHVLNALKDKFTYLNRISKILKLDYEHFKAMNRKGASTKPSLSLFKEMCALADIDANFIYSIKKIRFVDNNYRNPNLINVPEINEDLLYILGLLNSDGYISKQCISFVNKDEQLHNLFSSKVYDLFGLKTRRYKNDSSLCNKTLFELLKRIEKILPVLPDSLITAWLKGFVDGDGWVTIKENHIKNIGIATAKKEKAKLVQFLLLRLSILSKIEKKKVSNSVGFIKGRMVRTLKPKYDLIIDDYENIAKFASLISFRQMNRSHTLSKGLIKEIKYRRDIIPLGNLLRKFREENDLYQYELGFSDQNVRQIEKGRFNISRGNLQKIIQISDLQGRFFEKLKQLAYSDIMWDKIIDVEIVENEEYVYDLTTELGNFVANNVVMHNCGIAYGGELPAEELVRIIRFANRVPLLYQQSACAVYKSILENNWRNYSVSQSKGALPTAPMVIMVHMASVWVPFTSESKEAIAHYPEIIKEMKLALQECGRQLSVFLSRRRKAEHEAKKKSYIETYLPHIGIALKDILSLKEDDTKKVEKHLKEILEKHRGSEHDKDTE